MADWLAVFHCQGRTDLNVATLNRRRDAFLRHALEKLHTEQAQKPRVRHVNRPALGRLSMPS